MDTSNVEDSWEDALPRLSYLVGPGQRHSHVLLQYVPHAGAEDALLVVLQATLMEKLDCVPGSDYKTVSWICSAIGAVFDLSTETIQTYLRIQIAKLLDLPLSDDSVLCENFVSIFRSKNYLRKFVDQTT